MKHFIAGPGVPIEPSRYNFETTAQRRPASPMFALLFTSAPESQRAVITRHDIVDGRLGAPVFMGPNNVAEVLSSIGSVPGGWVDPSVIYSGAAIFAWYRPALRRTMLWVGSNNKTVRLNVAWPALVFIAARNSLRVFAVKEDSRPVAETPLFFAPVGNVNEKGVMCFGSATQPSFGLEHIAEYEAAFYQSRFSHSNFAGCVPASSAASDTVDPVATFWRAEAKKAKNPSYRFDTDQLIPTGTTLSEVLGHG